MITILKLECVLQLKGCPGLVERIFFLVLDNIKDCIINYSISYVIRYTNIEKSELEHIFQNGKKILDKNSKITI